MEKNGITLTPGDRVVLESYQHLCDGLSEYLGSGYEIVLHSLEDYDHSAIKVMNGEHTGRTVGAPITDLALFMLEKIRRDGEQEACHPYFSRNRSGEPLKSTTVPIYGEQHRIIGLLCINFYLSIPLNQFLHGYVPENLSAILPGKDSTPKKETYMEDVSDVLTTMIAEVQQELQGQSISSSNWNREVIAKLQDRGVFNLKNAVQKCADALGISKNTVYMHLRNLNDNK